MTPEELLQKANAGDMAAQYELAGHYGKLLKQTENEDEIYNYSLDAMLWLKRSAQQGYGPAVDRGCRHCRRAGKHCRDGRRHR